MPRLRSALAVPAALLALVFVAVSPAGSALAEGSVPSEVRAYVADGSLVHQLNDVYGVDAAGNGIDFDDTTTTGEIERVHVWSDELRAGAPTEHPVDLVNEWIVPISIAEELVGVATIWINPATVAPELASFVADVELAAALSEVPDGSSLIHDAPSLAWLALAEDGTLTPLVPGRTGLSTPVPVDDIALLPVETAVPQDGGDPGTGVGLAIAVLGALFAIIVVALAVPARRTRKKPEAEEPADADAVEPAALEAPAPKAVRATKTKAATEDD